MHSTGGYTNMRHYVFVIIAALSLGLALPARSAQQEFDPGNRLAYSQYAGPVIVVPKDKDFDPGAGFVYGMQWEKHSEVVFLDAAFAWTDASNSILWYSGDVRHTMVRLGYKKPVSRNRKLVLGADIQTQQMRLGSRKFTGVSFGVLADYKVSPNWFVEFESVQKTKRSGIYFGNFTLSILKYF